MWRTWPWVLPLVWAVLAVMIGVLAWLYGSALRDWWRNR